MMQVLGLPIPLFGFEAEPDSCLSPTSPTNGQKVMEEAMCGIPSPVTRKHRGLALTPYEPERGDECLDAVAMPHNACRLEMFEMWCDVLPSLISRKSEDLTTEDALDLENWWQGFVRFALTTSLVDEFVINLAYKDILADFDAEARNIAKSIKKFETVKIGGLEGLCKKIAGNIKEFKAAPTDPQKLLDIQNTWKLLADSLCETYGLVETILCDINEWRGGDIAKHPDLEKQILAFYADRKRWRDSEDKCAEMMIILTRWLNNEAMMRRWLQKNLVTWDKESIDKWLDYYSE